MMTLKKVGFRKRKTKIQILYIDKESYDSIMNGECVGIMVGKKDIDIGDLIFEEKKSKNAVLVEVRFIIRCTFQDIPDEFITRFKDKFELFNKLVAEDEDFGLMDEVTIIKFEFDQII